MTKKDRSEHAQVAEAITVFSHDAKNTLTSLQSFAHLLYRKSGNTGDPSLKEYVQKITNKVFFLTTQINQLADYARLQSNVLVLQKEQVDVQRFLLQQEDILKTQTKSSQIIINAPENIEVSFDRLRISYCILLAVQLLTQHYETATIMIEARKTGTTIDMLISPQKRDQDQLDTSHPAFMLIQEILLLHSGSVTVVKDKNMSIILHLPV